jgi:hypothetical protein
MWPMYRSIQIVVLSYAEPSRPPRPMEALTASVSARPRHRPSRACRWLHPSPSRSDQQSPGAVAIGAVAVLAGQEGEARELDLPVSEHIRNHPDCLKRIHSWPASCALPTIATGGGALRIGRVQHAKDSLLLANKKRHHIEESSGVELVREASKDYLLPPHPDFRHPAPTPADPWQASRSELIYAP